MELIITMGIPALVIGSIGLLFGLLLGYAGKLFDVKEDPRVFAIREALPGANDGGCGFSGCDAFAAAVAEGKAKVTGCPVGGSAVAARISEIMGVAASGMKRKTAFVKCGGRTDVTAWRYEYNGLRDCAAMDTMPGGGPKDCLFGCLGGGNCERACQFGAISMRGGIAVVDRTKCTACGMCVAACPRALIELVDEDKTVRVACNSKDSGKRVMSVCKAGCIGCKMCQRACQYGAIVMDGTLARVDYEKCVKCGACAEKCRTGAILDINGGAR